MIGVGKGCAISAEMAILDAGGGRLDCELKTRSAEELLGGPERQICRDAHILGTIR